MATIKCRQCNLVNFSTQINCKRCGVQLSDFVAAPTVVSDAYSTAPKQPQFHTTSHQTQVQPPVVQQRPSHGVNPNYAPFQQPPPPAYYSGEQGYAPPSCMYAAAPATPR